MKKYQASCIGDLFYDRLSANSWKFTGEIHSVFTNVINIRWEQELYTIGKAMIGNGPCTILLSILADDLDRWNLEPGELVRGDQRGILLGSTLRIDLKGAKVWTSDWKSLKLIKFDEVSSLIAWARELIIREGDLTGLGMLIAVWKDYTELPGFKGLNLSYRQQVILQEASRGIYQLREGLLKEPELFKAGVSGLVGLGPGLTPAGDDFLVGFFLTFHYLEKMGLIKGFGERFITGLGLDVSDFALEVQHNTNLISAMAVLIAIKGRPFQLVRDVIQAIFSVTKVQTTLSVLRLIDRGTTSGTDILTGIVVGCDLFLQMVRMGKTG